MSFKPCKHARCGGMWRRVFLFSNPMSPVKHLQCDRCYAEKAIYPRKGRLVMKSC